MIGMIHDFNRFTIFTKFLRKWWILIRNLKKEKQKKGNKNIPLEKKEDSW